MVNAIECKIIKYMCEECGCIFREKENAEKCCKEEIKGEKLKC